MVCRASTPLLALSLVAFTLAAPLDSLRLQEEHEHGGTPPQRLGRVDFPTTCSATARPRVERGVALLHSFWYEEAAKTFKEAAAADSTCAMSYWGQAMSRLRSLWTPPGPADSQEGLGASEHAVSSVRRGPRS